MIQNIKVQSTDTEVVSVPDIAGSKKVGLLLSFCNIDTVQHTITIWALNVGNGDTTANTIPYVIDLPVLARDTYEFPIEKFLLERNSKIVVKADVSDLVGALLSNS